MNKLLAIAVLLVGVVRGDTLPLLNSYWYNTFSTDWIAYWTLDEAAGSTRVDIVGDQDLTDNGTYATTTGKIGDAANHTGSGDPSYLFHADSAPLSVADIDFTWTCWVNPNSVAVASIIYCKGQNVIAVSGFSYTLTINGASKFQFTVSNGVASGAIQSSTNLSNGTWYFVAAWHDASANTVNIQVNNGTVESTSYSGGSFDESHQFRLSQDMNGNFKANAAIDELGFWKRFLTSTERSTLYNNGNGHRPP